MREREGGFLVKKKIRILFKAVLSYINMKINLIYSSGFNKKVIVDEGVLICSTALTATIV